MRWRNLLPVTNSWAFRRCTQGNFLLAAHRSAAFVVVLAPLNWLVDNYSGLADLYPPSTWFASLLLALDDLERNSNGTDGVMSRRTPNACGEEGTDKYPKD